MNILPLLMLFGIAGATEEDSVRICDERPTDRDESGEDYARPVNTEHAGIRLSLRAPQGTWGEGSTWLLTAHASFGGRLFEWSEELGASATSDSEFFEFQLPSGVLDLQQDGERRWLIAVNAVAELRDHNGHLQAEFGVPTVYVYNQAGAWGTMNVDEQKLRAPHGILGEMTTTEAQVLDLLEGNRVWFEAPIEANLPERPDVLLSDRDRAWPESDQPDPLPNTTLAGPQ